MEPRHASLEGMPSAPTPHEQAYTRPDSLGGHTEVLPGGRRNEQIERRLGQHIESASNQPAVPPAQTASLPAPVVAVQSDDDAASTVSDDMPIIAADEDLIEKEWVDRAKKIIAETKDDPYKREQEVKRLQVDYVKKRYGKSIGVVDNSAWEN